MKNIFLVDERGERINGYVSFFVLMLTQMALFGTLAYRRYALGMDVSQQAEFTIIAIASFALYWGARLYFSGIFPKPSPRNLVVVYAILVAALVIPSLFIHGLPTIKNWMSGILLQFIAPAVVLGLYSLIVQLGQRRLDREIGE
jgi:hypothetical protein